LNLSSAGESAAKASPAFAASEEGIGLRLGLFPTMQKIHELAVFAAAIC
jgi:hypothetical protein